VTPRDPPPAGALAQAVDATAGPPPAPELPSKTLATWIAVLLGCLGLHHVYLGGRGRWLAALYPLPTLAGLAGVLRMRALGVDDRLSWLLVPWLGVTISVGMLCAIVIGLTPDARWARRYGAGAGAGAGQARGEVAADDEEAPPGLVRTGWGPVLGVITALMVGGGVLMGTIAFSVQKLFEW
jgi:hypothetical protein